MHLNVCHTIGCLSETNLHVTYLVGQDTKITIITTPAHAHQHTIIHSHTNTYVSAWPICCGRKYAKIR